jgi:methylase of polypeptide subunit release factors
MHYGKEIHDYESYLLSLAKRQTKEVNINVKNLTFYIRPSVFNPSIFDNGIEQFIDKITTSNGGSFLDFGCGCGIFGVFAAKNGYDNVVALDINHEAIKSTEKNANINNVTLKAIHSNLFKNLEDDVRFDTIFWHHPYNYENNHKIEDKDPYISNLIDKDYKMLQDFLFYAPNYLNQGGVVYIVNGKEIGSRELFLERVCNSCFDFNLVSSFNKYGLSVDLFMLFLKPNS